MIDTIILFAFLIFFIVFNCLILLQLQEQADLIKDIKTMLRTYYTNELIKRIKDNGTENK